MRSAATPSAIISIGNTLGESVLWDERAHCLWWTDIEACALFRMAGVAGELTRFATPQRLCSFGLIAGDHRLIAAFEHGFARYDPRSGVVDWLATIEQPGGGRRMNDGRVDRSGRFWAGSMVEDAARAGSRSAALYRLDGRGGVSVQERFVSIANGLAWSPDGDVMYFADSAQRCIYTYDLDADSGAVTARRVFATTPEHVFPDGAAVDVDGCLWSAQWGAGCVVRYRPDGAVDRIVEVNAPQPTCLAFGGANLDVMFVTSARVGLDAAALARSPDSGGVFMLEGIAQGLAEERFVDG